jgi:hypothetical protein
MFPITAKGKDKDGKPITHEVKALEIIWQKLPQFNAKNSIHVMTYYYPPYIVD